MDRSTFARSTGAATAASALCLLVCLNRPAAAQDISAIHATAPKPAPAKPPHAAAKPVPAKPPHAPKHRRRAAVALEPKKRVAQKPATIPKPAPEQATGLDQDLLAAAETGDMVLFQHYLDKGVSLSATQADGTTSLMLAGENDRMNVVQFLVEQKKVNLEIRNRDKRTALSLAAFDGRTDVVTYLIGKGAIVNVHDAGGNTPLMLAVEQNHPDTVEALINSGVDINSEDSFSNTPLIQASKQGELAVVEELLAARPKPRLRKRNLAGQTALSVAQAGNFTDIVTALQAAGEGE